VCGGGQVGGGGMCVKCAYMCWVGMSLTGFSTVDTFAYMCVLLQGRVEGGPEGPSHQQLLCPCTERKVQHFHQFPCK
jgi:hypothetical protein